MTQMSVRDGKTQIIAAFGKLRADYNRGESKVATREEEARKEKNQELLEVASSYTIDSIVKGMADLQLDFGSVIEDLSNQLTREASKLEELKGAIAVEQENLEQMRKIRLVADALYLLRQEHRERVEMLLENGTRLSEAIAKDQAQTQKAWEKEQQEFEIAVQEATELLIQQRNQERADYQYEIERRRKVEMDEYEEDKRLQERELRQTNVEKERAWAEREQFLAAHEAELKEYQKKIATFDEELKQAYDKAKGDAIQDVNREAKVKTDLLEKEWEATQQGYELKIQSLEATIERQTEQLADITTQLQAAVKQAQDLAMRAFSSSSV